MISCTVVAAATKLHQSCPTLCNPIESSPPGSSVPGILQARILEWVAISFSNACMHAKSLQSCLTLCDPMDSSQPGSSSTGFSRQEYWSEFPFPSPDFMYTLLNFLQWQQFTYFYLFQFSHSVVSTLCDSMNHSTPRLPVHHQLLESTQTHVL